MVDEVIRKPIVILYVIHIIELKNPIMWNGRSGQGDEFSCALLKVFIAIYLYISNWVFGLKIKAGGVSVPELFV